MKYLVFIPLFCTFAINAYSFELSDFCKSHAAKSLSLDQVPAIFLKDENATLTLNHMKKELHKEFEANCKLNITPEELNSKLYDSCYKRAKSGFAEPHLILVNRECDNGYRIAEAYLEAAKKEKESCDSKGNSISNLKRDMKKLEDLVPSSNEKNSISVPK